MAHALARRSARLLGASWAVAWAGVPISGAFGSVVILELTGNLGLTGAYFSLLYVGSLVASYPAGHAMDRFGRKPVLIAGHLLAAVGFAIGTFAIAIANIWLFLASHLVASMGAGTTYLTRIAIADLYPAAQRARGLGRLSALLVLGAVASVPLIWLARSLEPVLGRSYLVAAWGVVPLLSLAAAFLVTRIHPDPKVIGEAIQAQEPAPPTPLLPGAKRVPWRIVVAAGATLLFAQAAMAGMMSVSGAALRHDGHGPDFIIATLTLHVVGMFGFSPLVGVLGDRYGRKPLLVASALYLCASTFLTWLVPLGSAYVVTLVAVGIGWSFAFIGANTLIADVVPVALRGRVNGVLDVAIGIIGAASSLGAGAALQAGGLGRVAALALTFAVGVVVASWAVRSLPRAAPAAALPALQDLGK